MSINNSSVDTSDMTPISALGSADFEYIDEVIELSTRATTYLGAMPWCEEIINGWLCEAWGHIIGVFYFHFRPSRPGIPHFVWIIVGDLPPAYLAVETGSSAVQIVEGYVCEMQEWVDRVMSERPIDGSPAGTPILQSSR